MIIQYQPAEVSDAATAVYEGTDAVMLSAEFKAGKYPLEAVRVMSRVAKQTEQTAMYLNDMDATRCPPEHTSSDAITAAARQVAETIGAAAIVTYTTSGSTAMRASRERTLVPVIAMTPVVSVARRLALVWGLNVYVTPIVTKFKETVKASAAQVRKIGLGGDGENCDYSVCHLAVLAQPIHYALLKLAKKSLMRKYCS